MEEDDGCSGPPSFDDSHLRLPPLVSLPDPHRLLLLRRVRADGDPETTLSRSMAPLSGVWAAQCSRSGTDDSCGLT
jgi:hypothetical protein